MMQQRTVLALAAVIVAATAVPAVATPAMTTFDNGTIAVQQPKGWTVQVNVAAGAITMQENPKREDSPTIVVVRGPYRAGTTAVSLMDLAFQNMGVKPTITARQVERGGNGLQVLAVAKYKGMNIRLAVVTVVSPNTNESMFAALLTRAARFDKLGGMSLLHAVAFSVRRAGAVAKPPSVARAPSPAGIRYVPFPKASLVGSWDRVGIGGMMNRVDIHGRVVGTDSRGSGTSYRFFSNGRYQVYYLSELTSGVCRSRARIGETGRYEYDGQVVTLRPSRYSGDICVCCVGKRTTKVNKRAPVRQYQVKGIAGKPHAMVLRGHCAPYMVDAGCSSTDAIVSGRKHDLTIDFTFGRAK